MYVCDVCQCVCVCTLGGHNGLEGALIILHQGGPEKGLDQIRSTVRLWMTLVFLRSQKA